jgi:hypothetical protein
MRTPHIPAGSTGWATFAHNPTAVYVMRTNRHMFVSISGHAYTDDEYNLKSFRFDNRNPS